MRRRFIVATVVVLTAGGLVSIAPAGAIGPGTFTRITSPGSPIYINEQTAIGGLKVKGVTSADVTAVDVFCYGSEDSAYGGKLNGTPIPVTSKHFSATIGLTFDPDGCVLRAIPDGTSPTYVASFRGPLLLTYVAGPQAKVDNTGGTDYVTLKGGSVISVGIDNGGIVNQTVIDPVTRDPSQVLLNVMGVVSEDNATEKSAGLVVDGHYSYTTYEIQSSVHAQTGLTYTVPTVGATFHHTQSPVGDSMRLTFPLSRCTGVNETTPTSTSCPSVKPVHVDMIQTATVGSDGRQVTTNLAFKSTNGKPHKVTAYIDNILMPPESGTIGYVQPGASGAFKPVTAAGVKVGKTAPRGIQTTYAERDVDAAPNDPDNGFGAITDSSQPHKFSFYGNNLWEWPISRKVPAKGTAAFSFVTTSGTSAAAVRQLAGNAQRALAGRLVITSPKAGATVHSGKVTVTVVAHASGNGLPAGVKVGKTLAKLTHLGATTATYRAKISIKSGHQTITAHATDPGGVGESAHLTVTPT